jgi:hypothetical protein
MELEALQGINSEGRALGAQKPITAAALGRVYILASLKVLHEYPLVSDSEARNVFCVSQFDALRVKVCARFEGAVDLSVVARVLGFDQAPSPPT